MRVEAMGNKVQQRRRRRVGGGVGDRIIQK